MRLWTIHPQYLDVKGLLAAWREALLAQKVLEDRTKGYKNHPQLKRFKETANPAGAIGSYLRGIQTEAVRRGYRFSEDKINPANFEGVIDCTRGQLLYEWNHLRRKVRLRDAGKYTELESIKEPQPHPLFNIIEGDIEDWEII
jgi:hypothetical protein